MPEQDLHQRPGDQAPVSSPEMIPVSLDGRTVGEVSVSSEVVPDNSLYHPGSINPTGRRGGKVYVGSSSFYDPNVPHDNYSRSIDQYVDELRGAFNPQEWVVKNVLDIGSGAYDSFGRAGRQLGINVVSINPALKDKQSRDYLFEALKHDTDVKRETEYKRFEQLPLWRRMFGRMNEIEPEKPMVVQALGQQLPFKAESFDAVVSVYGVPHYLHHVDTSLDRKAAFDTYTPEIRARDKALIGQAFDEIVRVLKPGGKGYMTDDHRAPGQTESWNKFSPSDGTEVVEDAMHDGRGSIKRVIVLQKPDKPQSASV